MKPSDFTKTPIAEATQIPTKGQFVQILRDRFWAVSEDDCILTYKGSSPQCNDNEGIVERIIKGDHHPGVKVQFIPLVFLPHDCRDYV